MVSLHSKTKVTKIVPSQLMLQRKILLQKKEKEQSHGKPVNYVCYKRKVTMALQKKKGVPNDKDLLKVIVLECYHPYHLLTRV